MSKKLDQAKGKLKELQESDTFADSEAQAVLFLIGDVIEAIEDQKVRIDRIVQDRRRGEF